MEVFNERYDKIMLEDLSSDLQDMIKASSDVVSYDLNRHVQDKKVHISALDRDNWNNKAPNESPNLTGVPTTPTVPMGDSSNKIASTEFVSNALKSHRPEVASRAYQLAGEVNVSLAGAATSEVTRFNGLNDIVIPLSTVDTSALRGTIPQRNMSGTYNISITGNADHATTADTLNGVALNELVLKDSPALQGKPTAPTAVFGTATDQIATTKFVDKALKALSITPGSGTGGAVTPTPGGATFTPFNISVKGRAVSDPVLVDGSGNVEINIKALNIDYNDLSNRITVNRVNGHTVGSDVPSNAVFTDTVYTHPDSPTDLRNTEYTAVTVDRKGHVIAGRNPDTLNVNISKNAATATKLSTARKLGLTGITATAVDFDGSANVNINVTAVPAAIVTESESKQFITKTLKDKLEATLSASEIESKIAAAQSGMEWKEAVRTEAELATKYSSPKKGWTVSVTDTGNTHQYNGTKWIVVSSNSIPNASTTADGKMSKEDKAKLDGIAAGANNYVLPETLPASMIAQDDNHYFVTKYQNSKLANLYNRKEFDDKFVTKAQLAAAKTNNLGGGWTLAPAESGELIFSFNNVEKARLGTDGTFKSVHLEEVGGN